MNSTSELILKYQEQNAEIARINTRLNERVAILENVIYELQQDNIQLRINNALKQRMNKKGVTNKKQSDTFKVKKKKKLVNDHKEEEPLQQQQPQKESVIDNNEALQQQQQTIKTTKKRSCSSKPINYILPSTKCKLRKGDPFTFGNE